jgi:hypothetical protein
VNARLAQASAWANRHSAGIDHALETWVEWTFLKAAAPLVIPALIWEYIKDETNEEA